MRNIYLIRHGRPDFPEGEKWCLGRVDIALGTMGRLQACLTGEYLKQYSISHIFCSSLSRSIETARFFYKEPVIFEGLEEAGTGEWDGLSFQEIRRRWPELYAMRAENLELLPPGAEKMEHAAERFANTIQQILQSSQGDIAIVAHKTVNQLFLCQIQGVSLEQRHAYKLDYASVSILTEEEGRMQIQETGLLCRPSLTEEVCRSLLQAAGVPQPVQAHCQAVAAEAKRIGKALAEAGYPLDEELLVSSAWLHDIARTEKDHPAKGALWMKKLGYEKVADVIAQHHDLKNPLLMDEAAVVHLADKCIQGTVRVSLAERFAASSVKCQSEEAKQSHRRRYEVVQILKKKLHELCGKQIVW